MVGKLSTVTYGAQPPVAAEVALPASSAPRTGSLINKAHNAKTNPGMQAM